MPYATTSRASPSHEESLVVRIDFTRREELLQLYPDTLFVPPRFDAHQKVVVRIEVATHELVGMLIREAWILQTSSSQRRA